MSKRKVVTKYFRPRRRTVVPARRPDGKQLPDTSARDHATGHVPDEDVTYSDDVFREENTRP